MLREKDPRILVFDSGLGGLSVLSALGETLPQTDYVYLADNARFPYGDLDDDELTAGLVALLQKASSTYQPDLIVIACNTASTVALGALRAAFSIPIVGIVPAIKPAAHATRTGHVAVLATPGTIRRSYTQDLIRDFAHGVKVDLIACPGLAGLAEDFVLEGKRDEVAVRAVLSPLLDSPAFDSVDVVVLGCTHYPLLLPVLDKLVGHELFFIDPAPAVARRVMHLLGQEWQDCLVGSPNDREQLKSRVRFVATGGGEERLKRAWLALLQVS
ncbi:glutamate racemase [uncultured Cohaesibacter sp.]|uniref:glutamate racemase n=1 Tax=uncultured Cohaesibacter sp. TaxID=1002546 RepID=UPI0029C7EA7A|nr:glutamate racemase [uncultured Cohaesibacter sp.]